MAYVVILREVESQELLPLATFDDLNEALLFAKALDKYWPADYSVRDLATGTDVALHERHWPRGAARWKN